MYLGACNCKPVPCPFRGMGGLGASDTASALIPIAATLVGGPGAGAAAAAATGAMSSGGSGGGGGGAMMPQQTSVSPQISTQISPQISPNFQQQFQPQNSAMTAGTSQSLPAMPSMIAPDQSGMVPGGVGVPGYAQPQPQMPQFPQAPTNWAQYMPYALAGLGIVAFVTLKKRSPKKVA